MLPGERPALEHALDRPGHVEPAAAHGRIQGHDAVRAQTQHQLRCLVAGEIVPHQKKPQRRHLLRQGEVPAPPCLPDRPRRVREAWISDSWRGQLGQDRGETLAQPRMQHRIRTARDRLQAHLAGGGMEQGQDLGRAATDILVRLPCWSRAAATAHQDAVRLGRDRLRLRTRPTAPSVRPVCRPARSAFVGRRIRIADTHHAVLAVAQGHAGLAPGAALLPAQAGLVQDARDGEPTDPRQATRRKALCRRLNDQVALPSCSRCGARAHSARMRCCS